MDMWGKRGKVPIHILLFGYPVGNMIAPLIAYPFVSGYKENTTDTCNESSTTVQSSQGEITLNFEDNSQIEIPFAIIGLLVITMATVFLGIQLSGMSKSLPSWQNKQDMKWKDLLSFSKWADGNFKFGVTMCVLIICFYVIHVSGAKGINLFYPTYAVQSELNFTAKQATLYTSLINFASAIGRLITIGLAKLIPINAIVFVEVDGETVFSISTLIWGLNSKASFIVFSCLFNLFANPIAATNYAWIDQYISLLATVMAVTDIAINVTLTLYTLLMGYLYTNTVKESLFYFTVVANCCLCVFIIIRHVIAERHGNRYTNAKNKTLPVLKEVEDTMRSHDADSIVVTKF